KGALQERDGFLRLTLAEEEDAVIDARILVRYGAAIQSDSFAESFARFGHAAQTLLAESDEAQSFGTLRGRFQVAPQNLDGGLKPVEQIQGPAIVQAGIRRRGDNFTGVTKRF